MVYIAYTADYWSSSFSGSATDYRSYNLYFFCDGRVNPSAGNTRSYGLSLRCVQE